ncbi:TfoX/Sxy family protein [Gordonia sp. CPCC 206044]|uniref:TfoX/Sxy family protein n=1 Tax=Gordonia sp. CPCC 206044 TaxID=3140793 RepID=UPI003AF3EFBD
MAYDEDLADRIRECLSGQRGITEKKMFGGLAFLINGNMAVAASGRGGLMVRVGTDAGTRLVSRTHAEPMVMGGREMTGWLHIGCDGIHTNKQLSDWVARGTEFTRSLPAKAK